MQQTAPTALAKRLIATLDINDYEDTETGILTLTNPATGEPTSSTITLASREHSTRKQLDMTRMRKMRSAFTQTGKVPVSDPVDDFEDETDYLVSITLGWSITQNGQPLEFSAAQARALYTDPKKQWLRQQVVAGMGKQDLFIQSSAKA